jgi:5-oxoprolinase (ATP-hydrolysing) subunit A
MAIDLNADVGEGMDDAALLPFLTSANVACGLHAGDPTVMDATVEQALARGVRVGAHPGYPDRENFGRIRMDLPAAAIERLVLYQIAALEGFVRSRGARLTHVKPHGALYHAAAQSRDVAHAIAAGVRRAGADLVVVAQPGTKLLDAAREAGLPAAAEAFADRRYRSDGTLVPRTEPDALLTDPEEAAEQALSLARDRFVLARDGSRITVEADTICVHGDTPGAPEIARRIRERFHREGIAVSAFDRGARRQEGVR